MRHARSQALDDLEDLLTALRPLPGLKEKSRGIFYRRATAFLHFHEDPEGLFADIRCGEEFVRYRVTTAKERTVFLTVVRSSLGSASAGGPYD